MQSEFSLRDTVRIALVEEDRSLEHILDFFVY